MHRVDIGSEEDIANLFKEIEKEHGTHVDILISNAGRGKRIVDILYVFSLYLFLSSSSNRTINMRRKN